MTKTRGSLSLLLAGLLISACASVGPGTTIPPINIPSFNIPTFPPIVIPSFPLPPGFTLPPFDLPSGDPNAGTCPLVTAAEVGGIMGSVATVTSSDGDSCTYTLQNFSGVGITRESGDLATVKMLMGDTARDITVGAYPGVSGAIFGQAVVYVQRGAEQLQVLGVLTGNDEASIAKIVQIATIAASRW
jgi:hypothetical protein